MKKATAFILAFFMLFGLTGCGLIEKLPVPDFLSEEYTCVCIAYPGDTSWKACEEDIRNVLKKDGGAVYVFDGYEYDLRWEADEEGNIELKMGAESVMTGTLEDGVIRVCYGENCMMLLAKDGVKVSTDETFYWLDAPEITEEPTPSAPATEPSEENTAPATQTTEPAPVVSEPTESETTAATEASTEPEGKFYPYLDMPLPWMMGTFRIVGAELIETGINSAALRLHYDFTNTSSETIRTQEHVIFDVFQNGQLCNYAWTEEEDEFLERHQISDLLVRPGCTVRCIDQYEIDPGAGTVDVTITTSVSQESITFTFDPADLPGAPAEEYVPELIPEPSWTNELSDGGVYNGEFYVYIDRAEITQNEEGGKVLRVYFDFTNNSAIDTSFWINSFIHAYQDGLELRSGYPLERVEEDDLFYELIAPGETVSASVCFELRSDSNVEIELVDYVDGSASNLGCCFIVG